MNSIQKVLTACAGVAACFALTACGSSSVSPDNCCDIKAVGADGFASVQISPDYEELKYAAFKCLPDGVTTSDRDEVVDFVKTITFEADEASNSNLSNGDKITIKVNYDADTAKKKYNFSFSSDTFTYTVSDLKKAEPVDPFDGFVMEFNGFSPKAGYSININGCSSIVRSYVDFEVVDAPEYVANGDTVTVRASVYRGYEDTFLQEGYVLSQETKTFTVSGLEEGKTVDPFEKLVIEYTGISPKASVKLDSSRCDDYVRNNVRFSVDSGNIANGEMFTVYAYYDENKAEQNGIVFTDSEKTYTAEGIPYYMNDPEGMDFTEADQLMKDYVEQMLAKNNLYKGSENIYISKMTADSSCKYIVEKITIKPSKRMVFIPKNSQDSRYSNIYMMVYQIDCVFKKTEKNRYCNCGIEEGDTVKATFYVNAYTYNISVSDDNVNASAIDSFSSEIYWPNDYSDLSAETVTEKWRTQNLADYNITITDVK